MKVLGIDPGIGITGYAIVEEDKGKFFLLDQRALTTPTSLTSAKRLEKLYDQLVQLVQSQKPDVCALETLIFNTNVTTAFAVGQARGVIILALAKANIPVVEYSPIQVKMAITGYGRAEKSQIQQMVKQILKLPKVLSPDDVADAAAIALTHLFSYKMKNSSI